MIRDFSMQDYEDALALWQSSERIGLSSADDHDEIKRFLERNPGMSKVVVEDGRIVGTILCGYDGRRGYLYHLCVDATCRRQGLGKKLVDSCLGELKNKGIRKCHLFIFGDNQAGKDFWRAIGWQDRLDISVLSKDIEALSANR